MKKRLNICLFFLLAFVCVGFWGCGIDTEWGEREFRAYDVAKVVGFIDDSLVIVADSREWVQETPDYAIGGHGHQRLRVFNYRVQEDGPRFTDTLDNFVEDFNYVMGQLSDSVIWGAHGDELISFWKIGEKPVVKDISVKTDGCSQKFEIQSMRTWTDFSIIAFNKKSLGYGGDTCQYALLDTIFGTLTYKRKDKGLEWIEKCDDVRAWGDDVYCLLLDQESYDAYLIVNESIKATMMNDVFYLGAYAKVSFLGNYISLHRTLCKYENDEITKLTSYSSRGVSFGDGMGNYIVYEN